MNATAEKLAETKKAQYWERKEDMRIIREEHEKVKEQREKEIAARRGKEKQILSFFFFEFFSNFFCCLFIGKQQSMRYCKRPKNRR